MEVVSSKEVWMRIPNKISPYSVKKNNSVTYTLDAAITCLLDIGEKK